MTNSHDAPIEELDLLAYADGRLERDPARKALVEAYLREHPDEAARVDAYARQNAAIRHVYAEVSGDAPPERLLAVLDRNPQRWGRPVARAVAAAASLMLAATAGWWYGSMERGSSLPEQAFVEQTMFRHLGPAMAGATEEGRPLVSLSQRLALEVQPPDLSTFGFNRVEMRAVGGAGASAGSVRVTYANASGERINLFLRTRWQDASPPVNFVERDGVSLAYWPDGPLVYGLAARIDHNRLAEIANAIRQASHPHGGPGGTALTPPLAKEREPGPGASGPATPDGQPIQNLSPSFNSVTLPGSAGDAAE